MTTGTDHVWRHRDNLWRCDNCPLALPLVADLAEPENYRNCPAGRTAAGGLQLGNGPDGTPGITAAERVAELAAAAAADGAPFGCVAVHPDLGPCIATDPDGHGHYPNPHRYAPAAVRFGMGDDDRTYAGIAIGRGWNGFDRMEVSPETLAELAAEVADLFAPEERPEYPEPGPDGWAELDGFTTYIAHPDPELSADDAESLGFDPTGRDGDPRYPFRESDRPECGYCGRPAVTTRPDVGAIAPEPTDGPLCADCAATYDTARRTAPARPVFVLRENTSGDAAAHCGPCIATMHDVPAALASILRRDDGAECMDCGYIA